MRSVAAALMLAAITACSGYTNGTYHPGDSGLPIVGGTTDAGDGGPEGGDGGPDAGPDAGCGPLTLNVVPAFNYCPNGLGVPTYAQGTVNTTNCTIDITISNVTGPCLGAVSGGTANAFDGGCQGGFYTCTSPSLPGTLTCFYGSNSSCTIKICDAGTSCP